MKTLLAFSLSFLGLIPARGDLPAPKPTSITVTNISTFPQYKFSYRAGDQKGVKAIVDGQSFTALADVALLVQSGEDPSQTCETVKYDWRGAKVNFKVEGVKQDGRQISVTYKKSGGDAVPKKTAAAGPVPLFALAGLSTCALVVFARRRRAEGGVISNQ